jgi:hypothetical protein
VVVVDLQVGLPQWPPVRPAAASHDERIERLGWWEALLKRGSAKSALLTLFDDPRPARRWIRRVTGLFFRPPSRSAFRREPEVQLLLPGPAVPAAASPTPHSPESIHAYEKKRERELAAPITAITAFSAEKSITLYLVTPYGPYFDLTKNELNRIAVHGFLEESTRVYDSERATLTAEIELITR